ncbi:hypothetical protein BXZ70DRAFT_1012495 [Cristinia sonorae]|uniref:DUF6532 domain-containing protein n=1 Tax=Cristinia sonorae TaxID=1940300 RepID=A0A8K0UGQ4_9AGAR|nr:hypothetical protein BXZ70DRAFT_1012495 [Cristinia sonorae]
MSKSKRKRSRSSDSSDSGEESAAGNAISTSNRPSRKSKDKLMENPPWKAAKQPSSAVQGGSRKKQKTSSDDDRQHTGDGTSKGKGKSKGDSEKSKVNSGKSAPTRRRILKRRGSDDEESSENESESSEDEFSEDDDSEDESSPSPSGNEDEDEDERRGPINKGSATSKGREKHAPTPLKGSSSQSTSKSPDVAIELFGDEVNAVGPKSRRDGSGGNSATADVLENDSEIAVWNSERMSPPLPDRISNMKPAAKCPSVPPVSTSQRRPEDRLFASADSDPAMNNTEEIVATAHKSKAPPPKNDKSTSAKKSTNSNRIKSKTPKDTRSGSRQTKVTKREEKEHCERPEFSESDKDEVAEARPRKRSLSEKSKNREREPESGDSDTDNEPSRKRSKKSKHGKKRRGKHASTSDSSDSDSEWPSWMKLKTNGYGRLNLKEQKSPIRTLIKGAIRQVKTDCIFKTPYPEEDDKDAYIEEVLKKVAKGIAPELVDRLRKDSRFCDQLIYQPSNRLSHYRSRWYTVVEPLLGNAYGFTNLKDGLQLSADEIKARVELLTDEDEYRFVYRMQAGSYVSQVVLLLRRANITTVKVDPMMHCPYQHPLIIQALHIVLFRSSSGLGNRFADKFTSSIKEDNSPELPIPVVAMVGTAIQLCLLSWATGVYLPPAKNADSSVKLYTGHINFIEGLRVKIGPLKLHRLLANLLASARNASYVATKPTNALAAAHKVDAANMPE